MTQLKNSTFRRQAKARQIATFTLAWATLPASTFLIAVDSYFSLQLCPQALAQPATSGTRPNLPPIATDALSFSDRIGRLEQLNRLPASAGDSAILDRLSRLEQAITGQVRYGSIVERLKTLESIPVAPAQSGQPAAPAQVQPLRPATPANTPVPSTFPTPEMPARKGYPVLPNTVPANTVPPATTQKNAAPGSMADFIKRSHVAAIIPVPDICPPSFFRIQAASDNQADKSDYLDAVLKESKNKTLKFQKMPIPVYITPIGEFGYNKAVREAMDDWGGRTNGLITFVEVKNQKDARIVVVYNKLGVKPGSECSLGAHTVTKWKSRGPGKLTILPVGSIPVPLYIPSLGPKYSVPPQMIEVNLDVLHGQDAELRPLVLKNIATHELGHALGMLGHSPVKGDMMYTNTDEYSRISQRDINTVTKLYQRKADIPL